MITKSFFGNIKEGDVHAFTLDSGNLQVTVIEYGATIQSIKYCGKELVLGFDSAEEYAKKVTFFGATIGRVANRIAGARFTLNERECLLDNNDNGNCLHGGFDGYNKRIFKGETDGDVVKFTYLSPDGDQGFCGNLLFSVEYSLCGDMLCVKYIGTSDKDTYFAPTNHAFFNFSGADKPVYDTRLTINAGGFTPVDGKLIPTGEIKSVVKTAFDFTSPKTIGADICRDEVQLKVVGGGYDHNFALCGEHAATAESSGVKMDIYTNMPGLQFYSGNFLENEKARGGIYNKHYAFCLEPQFFPDAVNQLSFRKPYLKAGEKAEYYINYKFDKV